jgi:hypothetical protein
MTGRAAGARALAALAAAIALAAGCGRKTDIRAPELVAPRAVGQLALTTEPGGVGLRWTRPTQYADGSEMEDLAGFVIERHALGNRFEEVARVPVTDRGRFQKAKRFAWVDSRVEPGIVYHYRIVAFTSDGYYSAPSDVAAITWKPPPASPAPGAASPPGPDARPTPEPTTP